MVKECRDKLVQANWSKAACDEVMIQLPKQADTRVEGVSHTKEGITLYSKQYPSGRLGVRVSSCSEYEQDQILTFLQGLSEEEIHNVKQRKPKGVKWAEYCLELIKEGTVNKMNNKATNKFIEQCVTNINLNDIRVMPNNIGTPVGGFSTEWSFRIKLTDNGARYLSHYTKEMDTDHICTTDHSSSNPHRIPITWSRLSSTDVDGKRKDLCVTMELDMDLETVKKEEIIYYLKKFLLQLFLRGKQCDYTVNAWYANH